MPHGLPPHIWIARIDDAIIVLDVRADRYSRLGRAASAVFVHLADQTPLTADQIMVAHNLVRAGLLTENGSGRPVEPVRLSLPTASALERRPINLGPEPTVIRCILGVVAAVVRVRFLGLDRTLRGARKAKARVPTCASVDHIVTYAQAFARRRTAIAMGRSCLPDSLALFGLATRAGLDVSLVIGVRDQPFAAHCWVQSRSFVLTDSLAPIRELTPILAI